MLRHCLEMQLLESESNFRRAQERLGHIEEATTMIYSCVLSRGGRDVRSLVDCVRGCSLRKIAVFQHVVSAYKSRHTTKSGRRARMLTVRFR